MPKMNDKIIEEIRKKAIDNKLPCATARKVMRSWRFLQRYEAVITPHKDHQLPAHCFDRTISYNA
jgi:hypothetical protein